MDYGFKISKSANIKPSLNKMKTYGLPPPPQIVPRAIKKSVITMRSASRSTMKMVVPRNTGKNQAISSS